MTLLTNRLPNGNVFIWFGTRKGLEKDEEGIDNALILSGGDVLILKTIESIPLWKNEVKKNIKDLEYREFIEKYGLENLSYELWNEVKRGVEIGKYPPFTGFEHGREEYMMMIRKYLSNLDIEGLTEIKKKCDQRIRRLRKSKENR